jgi:16S rRNA processing protein RimM
LIQPAGIASQGGSVGYEVEQARGYRDRLVLKLRGVDDAGTASALRGGVVLAPEDEIPPLPEGVFYQDRLLGFEVVEEGGRSLGKVEDVVETGGVALLAVRRAHGNDVLIPLARQIVLEVQEAERRIVVRLPEGLEDLATS